MAPQKQRDYGSAEDVTLRLYGEVGGLKEAAFLLDRKYSVIAAYSDPDHGTGITYDQVRRLTLHGAVSAARDLSALAGGVFVPGGEVEDVCARIRSGHDGSVAALGQTARDHGELMALVLAAMSDGKLDQLTEVPGLMRELDETINGLVLARAQLAKMRGAL